MPITEDFYQTVKQVETATHHFVMGDPAPFKAMWSHADDVSIFGAWGAYEKGWEADAIMEKIEAAAVLQQ